AREIMDQARKQAVRAEMVVNVEEGGTAAGPNTHCGEHERVVEIQVTRAEIAVLQADIDIVAYRRINTGQQLPREGMVAVPEFLDPGIARASADITADPAVAAQIEERVDHARKHAGMAVDVEITIDENIARAGVDRGHERIVDVEALDLGALVAELAFEPEQAEIVPADDVDII